MMGRNSEKYYSQANLIIPKIVGVDIIISSWSVSKLIFMDVFLKSLPGIFIN